MWHPFDDSRVLNDPNASGRGLWRPPEVANIYHNITPYMIYPLFCLVSVFKGYWSAGKYIVASI